MIGLEIVANLICRCAWYEIMFPQNGLLNKDDIIMYCIVAGCNKFRRWQSTCLSTRTHLQSSCYEHNNITPQWPRQMKVNLCSSRTISVNLKPTNMSPTSSLWTPWVHLHLVFPFFQIFLHPDSLHTCDHCLVSHDTQKQEDDRSRPLMYTAQRFIGVLAHWTFTTEYVSTNRFARI